MMELPLTSSGQVPKAVLQLLVCATPPSLVAGVERGIREWLCVVVDYMDGDVVTSCHLLQVTAQYILKHACKDTINGCFIFREKSGTWSYCASKTFTHRNYHTLTSHMTGESCVQNSHFSMFSLCMDV